MKASIELALRTREVYQLFERKINGNQLFISVILHKFNQVIDGCNNQEPRSLLIYHQSEKKIRDLTHEFKKQIAKFESLLAKKRILNNSKISYTILFNPVIPTNNPLAIQLIELLEIYDSLVAILKLLHLSGCFVSTEDYYANLRRMQVVANRTLSAIIRHPLYPKKSLND